MHAARETLAARYDEHLAPLPMKLPVRRTDRVLSWHLYAIEVDEGSHTELRAAVFGALRNANIGVNVHYIPIPTQPFFRRLGFKAGSFPRAES
jgi:dTDP-4-amino-4,6-dideoxygalactose transaminase